MPTQPAGIKHIQVKISTDEYRLLKQKAHSADIDITPFARLLFLAALSEDDSSAPVAHRGPHKLLEFILSNGNELQREWIAGNLQTFAELIRFQAKAHRSQ